MDLNKPLFYKSSNPQLAEIIQLTSHLFYWDESANMPIEIENGEGIMAPQDIEGDYIIWSDTYTLGFTSEADARPIFFSDGGQGVDKILKMINSVANRLGVAKFADLNAALAWAASEPRIYVEGSYEVPASLISSGLIAHLDASNSQSYSGSGNVWNDLTGNGHNATISGPSYSSVDGGVFEYSTNGSSISFNGANSLTDLSIENNILGNGGFTAQIWIYRPNLPSIRIMEKGGEYALGALRNTYTIGTNASAGPYATGAYHSEWNLVTLQAFPVDGSVDGYLSPTHPWSASPRVAFRTFFNDNKNMNVNYPGYDFYIDGVASPGSATNNPLEIAKSTFSSNTFTGKVGAFYFYDRVLTDQEVLDNYNATKSRYGLE